MDIPDGNRQLRESAPRRIDACPLITSVSRGNAAIGYTAAPDTSAGACCTFDTWSVAPLAVQLGSRWWGEYRQETPASKERISDVLRLNSLKSRAIAAFSIVSVVGLLVLPLSASAQPIGNNGDRAVCYNPFDGKYYVEGEFMKAPDGKIYVCWSDGNWQPVTKYTASTSPLNLAQSVPKR
jgi:hypothetical protein